MKLDILIIIILLLLVPIILFLVLGKVIENNKQWAIRWLRNIYLFFVIAIIVFIGILSTPKIMARIEGQRNKNIMIKYLEEKYPKKFRITYEYLGHTSLIPGRENDIININFDDENFPFKIEYDVTTNKIIDYYQQYYGGYLVKQYIEKKIYEEIPNLKYINSCALENYNLQESLKSVNDVILLQDEYSSLNFMSVIISEDEPDLYDYKWTYSIYKELASISKNGFSLNISIVKPEHFKEFQERFMEECDNYYDAEKYKDKIYYNVTLIQSRRTLYTEDEFLGMFMKF